jgi:hypothetical protein
MQTLRPLVGEYSRCIDFIWTPEGAAYERPRRLKRPGSTPEAVSQCSVRRELLSIVRIGE